MSTAKPLQNNNSAPIQIRPARPSDLAAILNLLTQCALPPDGLGQHLGVALVAQAQEGIIGSAALEIYGRAALLRSVAVAPAFQGQGLGHRLTRAALKLATEKSIIHLYLLTETAGEFFLKFGFQPIERADVPPAVQNSVEFTTACPASALAMALPLAHTKMPD